MNIVLKGGGGQIVEKDGWMFIYNYDTLLGTGCYEGRFVRIPLLVCGFRKRLLVYCWLTC